MTNFTKEEAKAMSILDVAISLGMEMKRDSHQEYYWTEHDSLKINVRKNTFSWYSRDIHGDVIDLVETVKGVSFKEAMHFLKEGEFPKATINQRPREPFRYTLQRFERPFEEARTYLKEQRGLSDATIDFFGQQGVLAQANKKAKDDYLEPVVVFKSLDRNKRVIGANLQGIIPNTDRYEGKGYLKQILFNSDGLAGMSVDVGSPKRLVFAEAPIDLMSYYELNKDKLQDVRLVAMDGLKEQTISRYTMELVAQLKGKEDYKPDLSKVGQALEALAKTTTFFKDGQNQDLITLAVDNDKAGRDFIEKLQGKGIPVQADLSPETKDWNDYLKLSKQGDKTLTQEKALGQNQELYYNAGGSHRNPDSLGDVSPGTASKPVVTESQPDFPVIAQLQFTTNNEYMSSIKDGYHVIKPGELARLNKFAPGIQATAQWYLNEVANSTIHYLYQDADAVGKLSIQFSEENFAHLTGISPKGVEMRQVVHDFAQGKGDYGNIQVSHAIKDKSMVLPLMPDILSPQAFVFDDLSSVEKFQQINLAQAIKTEDEDLLLAVRDVDGVGIPASIMRMKEKLAIELEGKDKVILGIYRERNGKIEQLSINNGLIKDGGKEMRSILENSLLETIKEQEVLKDQALSKTQFDSDGDGYTDQEEISLGTAPFDSQDHPGKTEEEPPKPSLSELIEAKDLKGLGQHMKEGIKTYLDSDQYKKFLNAMSKLHDYSPRNIAFLLAQNPDVSMVASFQKWKNDFDRQVQKGERGLKVWTPYTVKLKNPDGSPRLDKDGNEMSVTRFTLGTVFDVSQTQGKEIPKPIYNLEGDVPDFETIYLATKQTAQLNNVSIRFDTIEGSANGYYHPSKNEIVLADKQMSEAQILKTLFHEMAHADLHSKDTNYSRSEKELQAESVAYVVANHYGIDTSEYSFGYLKFWSQDPKGYEDLTNQLSVVSTEAKSLINRIDTQIEKVKSKSIFLDKFQSKLAQSKEKSNQLSQEKEREASQTMPKKPQHPTKDTSPNL
ncbi:PBECR4 domain-containing protein [Streptococcus suis]|uniref:PBECR4 domain-containing protein n=1 Tax=Streptococcus suis TaxID=1307 RepID=UPI000CF3912B